RVPGSGAEPARARHARRRCVQHRHHALRTGDGHHALCDRRGPGGGPAGRPGERAGARPRLSGPSVGGVPLHGRPSAGRAAGRRLAIIAVLAVVAAVAGSVVAIALTRATPASSVAFPLSILSGTVAAGRTWRLEGAVLTGRVTLTNAGSGTQTVVYDEVIPTS